MHDRLRPVHPGEVLLEEFIVPFGLDVDRVARESGIDALVLADVLQGRANVTADMALRLARYFGTSAYFWLGLQAEYDLDVARDRLGSRLDDEVRPLVRQAA